jgi:hypothetical protein
VKLVMMQMIVLIVQKIPIYGLEDVWMNVKSDTLKIWIPECVKHVMMSVKIVPVLMQIVVLHVMKMNIFTKEFVSTHAMMDNMPMKQ